MKHKSQSAKIQKCNAPVFKSAPLLLYPFIILVCLLMLTVLTLIWMFYSKPALECKIRQMTFRIRNCRRGNTDYTIDLNVIPDERMQRPAVTAAIPSFEEEFIETDLSIAPEFDTNEWTKDDLRVANSNTQNIIAPDEAFKWSQASAVSAPKKDRMDTSKVVSSIPFEKCKVDFDALPWASPGLGMRCKTFHQGKRRVRLVEFSKEFIEPDWCYQGRIGYVIAGQLVIDFNGTAVIFGPGDGLFISASAEDRHKIRTLTDVARVVFVEDV